jgi:ATP-binding cassette subfamily G (WHITE) protein 2
MSGKAPHSPASSASLYEPLNASHDRSNSYGGADVSVNMDAGRNKQDDGPAARVSLSFKDLVYEVKDRKTKDTKRILNGISGHVHYGQLMGILGPSGAGKTTMLDILAQRQKGGKVSGELLLNGHPVDKGVFRRVSAYVQQEDILHSYLSVRETIEYAARLRLPAEWTRDEIKEKTTHMMQLLGIEHVQTSKIGGEFSRGVSGGEKKRVAIAVELVTNPALIFLDEPTTGLDTFTALHLLHLLKRLSRRGATVIFSIHQPRSSIFRLFDVVLVLNGHGEEAYFGPADKAVEFIESCGVRQSGPDNPADFLLDSVSVVRSAEQMSSDDFPFLPPPTQAQDIAAAFRSQKLDGVYGEIDAVKRTYADDARLPPAMESPYPRNFFIQVSVVSSRAFINKLRDPLATIVSIFVAIFFAVLVGSIFWQLGDDETGVRNRLGVLFFLTMNTAFSSLGSLAMFLFDRSIYVREHKNGMYRPSAYYFGKILQDMPMAILVTFLFDVVAYFMVGLQSQKFGWFYLVSVLILLNSYSMCLMISSIAKDYQVANLIAPVLLVLYLLPSGFLINLDSLPVYWTWVQYVSFVRFGFEALVTNEMDGLTFCKLTNVTTNITLPPGTTHAMQFLAEVTTTIAPYVEENVCGYPAAEMVNAQLGFSSGQFANNVIWCSISAAVYFILGYLGLRFLRSNEGK